eukprot:SAG11_NODE_3432_length_2450_cov_2.080391_2_plen_71_part_00
MVIKVYTYDQRDHGCGGLHYFYKIQGHLIYKRPPTVHENTPRFSTPYLVTAGSSATKDDKFLKRTLFLYC